MDVSEFQKFFFNNNDWPWAIQLLILVLLAILFLLLFERLIKLCISIFSFVGDITKSAKQRILYRSLQVEEQRRLERRQQFADHVESEIRRLNSLEAWSHYRFTELEAEVEAEGAYRKRRFPFNINSGLRQEPSLSIALETSNERLVLVEGDPGAGKSVALRQVTLNMARKAMKSKNFSTPIPIFVNLKNLSRSQIQTETNNEELILDDSDLFEIQRLIINYFNMDELQDLCFRLSINYENISGATLSSKARELILFCQRHEQIQQLLNEFVALRPNALDFLDLLKSFKTTPSLPAINQELIREFVLNMLNRANDRDVEAFLEEEFDEGMRNGTWVFFFDSFDEIPEVLSLTDADEKIQQFGDAINDFLGGMNKCRGVIASRAYRGPQRLGWPRFRILPLKKERKEELVRKTGMSKDEAVHLIANLNTVGQSIRLMASNPLFLALISEYVREQHHFPKTTYAVYEQYISERIRRDKDRLWQRFSLEPDTLREASEKLAFSMTADLGLGLNPTRIELQNATKRQNLDLGNEFHTILNALEFIKLARAETSIVTGDERPFSFSHRRFQEYFTTSMVLRDPNLVSPGDLLMNGRWRETAVVLCQTQPKEIIQPIMNEANNRLSIMLDEIPNLIPFQDEFPTKQSYNKEENEVDDPIIKQPFPWPNGLLHLLGVLQEGFSNRIHELSPEISKKAGSIIWTVQKSGIHLDLKWALDVTGIVPQNLLSQILKKAFGQSQLINDVVYRQVVRLNKIPESLTNIIIQTLTEMMTEGKLRSDSQTIRTQLMRFEDSSKFLSIMNRLNWVPHLDFVLHISLLLTTWLFTGFFETFILFPGTNNLFVLYLLISVFLYAIYSLTYKFSYRSLRNWRRGALLFFPFLVSLMFLVFIAIILYLTITGMFPINETQVSESESDSDIIISGFTNSFLFLPLIILVLSEFSTYCLIRSVGGSKAIYSKLKDFIRKIPNYFSRVQSIPSLLLLVVGPTVILVLFLVTLFSVLLTLILFAFPKLGGIILIVFLGCISLPMGISFPRNMYELFLLRSECQIETGIYHDRFLKVLTNLKLPHNRIKYVKRLRQKQLLVANAKNRECLQNLIARIEIDKLMWDRLEDDIKALRNSNGQYKYRRRLFCISLAFLVSIKHGFSEHSPRLFIKVRSLIITLIVRILKIENILLNVNNEKSNFSVSQTEVTFQSWYHSYAKLYPYRLAKWNKPDFIDELSLLLEQLSIGMGEKDV